MIKQELHVNKWHGGKKEAVCFGTALECTCIPNNIPCFIKLVMFISVFQNGCNYTEVILVHDVKDLIYIH